MTEFTVAFCLIVAVLLVGLMLLFSAIRIVQEYERLVVFRLGRSIGEKGPGLVILWPFIDRGVKVDLREQVRDPAPASITKTTP
jgi:regulator of protease activity HflC (stomatin/prohibitin superfamily)